MKAYQKGFGTRANVNPLARFCRKEGLVGQVFDISQLGK